MLAVKTQKEIQNFMNPKKQLQNGMTQEITFAYIIEQKVNLTTLIICEYPPCVSGGLSGKIYNEHSIYRNYKSTWIKRRA